MSYLYALDISMSNTGVVVIDMKNAKMVFKTSISTERKELLVHKNQFDGKRLEYHYNRIKEIIEVFPPEVVVAERGFTRFNTTTQVLFRVHGVYQLAFVDVDFVYMTPKEVRNTLYQGNADKEDLRCVLEKRRKIKFEDYDQSDSYAVGLAYLVKYKNFPYQKPNRLTNKDIKTKLKDLSVLTEKERQELEHEQAIRQIEMKKFEDESKVLKKDKRKKDKR